MKNIPSFLIICFIIMTISCAGAATIIVNDEVEGENYTKIQDAVDNASDGDIVLVYPGNYTENIYVDRELTIVSLSGNSNDTIVHAANSGDDVFHITADNVNISGFGISGAETDQYGDDKSGIYFEGVNNSIVIKNNVSSNGYGIFLLDSYNNTLTENSEYMNRIGIFLWNSSNNKLNNNLINMSNHEGILLYTLSNNNEISNNSVSFTYAGFGIDLNYLCENNTLNNNVALNNKLGIFLRESNSNSLINNVANTNKWNGIDLENSTENSLHNNTVKFNNNDGIFLIESNDNELNYNNVSNNMEYGININNSSRSNTLTGNIVNSNGKENIHVVDPQNNTINDSAQKLPFQGSVLTITTIITIALILTNRILNRANK